MSLRMEDHKDYLAVDIAILPEDIIADFAIEINRKLPPESGNEIKLDRKSCIPHITLAMGCINSKDIGIVHDILNEISRQYCAMRLEAYSPYRSMSWLKIKPHEELKKLHASVMTALLPIFSYFVIPEMFAGGIDSVISKSTIRYIEKFPVESSYEAFEPHITVGSGEYELETHKIEFDVNLFGLCHLGDHCTCRQVIRTYKLRTSF